MFEVFRTHKSVPRGPRKRKHCRFQLVVEQRKKYIHRQQQNDPEASLKKYVIVSFIKKNHPLLRRIQRNKTLLKEHFRPGLMKWHFTLGKRLTRTRTSEPGYDKKEGNFLAKV